MNQNIALINKISLLEIKLTDLEKYDEKKNDIQDNKTDQLKKDINAECLKIIELYRSDFLQKLQNYIDTIDKSLNE